MAGLYPGMFGRVLVPMGEREAVLVPRSAVLRVGQLETVWVKDQGAWSRVFIKAGQQRDGMVEALAGLSGGETVAVPPGETPVPPEQALPLEGGNG
jgi:multidrug efflux pump subunit AcrA (membrane-fusion protein)